MTSANEWVKLISGLVSSEVELKLQAVKHKVLLGALVFILACVTIAIITAFGILSLITYKADLGAQLLSMSPVTYLVVAVVVLVIFCLLLLIMLFNARKPAPKPATDRLVSDAATSFFREATGFFEQEKELKQLAARNKKLEEALNILVTEIQSGELRVAESAKPTPASSKQHRDG